MKSDGQLTVIVCARNAERFVERAVGSAFLSGSDKVLLVDDYSDDETVRRAQSAATGPLKIVRPLEKRGLGNARQIGISNVDTEFAMWLDADDELLPGRVSEFRAKLESGADVVFDAAQLVDGETGEVLSKLEMPSFLSEMRDAVRLFERNYLPGPAWPGVNVAFARKVGYDPNLPTGEDIDFNLRAYRRGGRFAFLDSVGYRQFAYSTSLSRNRSLQSGAVARVLGKYEYAEVVESFLKEGFSSRIGHWAVASMALFRGNTAAAELHGRMAFPEGTTGDEVLEPNGPLPLPEAWRFAFLNGVVGLLEGRKESSSWFRDAEDVLKTPEGANNLGIALWREGDRRGAVEAFEAALVRSPRYLDALENLKETGEPLAITVHPLRRQTARQDYGQGKLSSEQ